MMLTEWANKWGVADAALEDLKFKIGALNREPAIVDTSGDSESIIQAKIRLEASRKGAKLWRNNVGAGFTQSGKIVRYGLCNESRAMNTITKSSDLIGINPILITRSHVGLVLGQFVAREVKHAGWHFTGTAREEAQLNFLKVVLAHGGCAAFVTGEGSM